MTVTEPQLQARRAGGPWRGVIAITGTGCRSPKPRRWSRLREGGTPLLPPRSCPPAPAARYTSRSRGPTPTGSFKDRGMTVAISMAAKSRRQGGDLRVDRQRQCQRRRLRGPGRDHLCGARAARQDRDRQARPGAGAPGQGCCSRRLVRRTGAGRKLAAEYPVALVNSVNPDRLQGQKPPRSRSWTNSATRDVHCLPVGERAGTSPPTGWDTPVPAGGPGVPVAADVRGSRPAARRRS